MDPLTLAALAKSVADITGLSDWLGDLIGPDQKDVVETVLDVAKTVTGQMDPKRALDELNRDPKLVNQARQELQKHRERLLNMVLKDKADARFLQKKTLVQGDLFSKRFIYIFAWFWSAVASIFIFLIVLYPIPAANVRFADTVLGFILGTVIATILQFFYGSMLKQPDDPDQTG